MTVSLNGSSIRKAPVPAASVPSQSSPNAVQLQVSGSTGGWPDGVDFAIGAAASRPTTYGDLTHVTNYQLGGLASGSYRQGPGGTIIASMADPNVVAGLLLQTGDHAWLCFIDTTGTPISGTVLDAVLDLGIVVG